MPETTEQSCGSGGKSGAAMFAVTRWTMVMAAAGQPQVEPAAMRALAELCQCYWPPLYSFIRWQGFDIHEAEDLTQEFFSRLLAGNSLESVDRRKGKFRSFLLASLKHFLANERDRARTLKRGGGRAILSLDAMSLETRHRLEPLNDASPDKRFEREWALTVLEQALTAIRADYAAAGKEALFDELKAFLTGDSGMESYACAGARLGLSEGALKVAVHRLRRRYRAKLHEEIEQTVSPQTDIKEEIRCLFAAFQ